MDMSHSGHYHADIPISVGDVEVMQRFRFGQFFGYFWLARFDWREPCLIFGGWSLETALASAANFRSNDE